MDIILTQDVQNLGYKNDLLKVKDGYARNYLIPKGLAKIASDSNKKQLAELKKQQAFKEEKIVNEATAIATALEGVELRIGVKAGESGKIFGSVNTIIVANALMEQKNIEIDRKRIEFSEDHIKEVGKYTAKIRLHKNIAVEIALDVVAE